MNDKLLTFSQVGQLLEVTRQTIHKWVNDEELPYVYKGKKRYIKKSAVENYLRERNLEGTVNWSLIE